MTVAAVQNKVSIVLHDKIAICSMTVRIGGPFRSLRLSLDFWIVDNKVTVFLSNDMKVTRQTVSVRSPDWFSFFVVDNEVPVSLHNCVEFSVLADYFLTCV